MQLSKYRYKVLACALALCLAICGLLCMPTTAAESSTANVYNAAEFLKSEVERVSTITDVDKTYFDQSKEWIYEEHGVTKNETDEYFLTSDRSWSKPASGLKMGGKPTNTTKINNRLGKCMFYHAGSSGKIGQSIGYYEETDSVAIMSGHINGLASALTFVAPKSGNITLSDQKGGMIAQLGYGLQNAKEINEEIGTLRDSGDKIGFAIYKNEEKLWPEEKEYSVTETGKFNYPKFPELKNIKVEKDDKIRIVFMPLTERWGFFQLNPQVSYTEASKTYGDFNSDENIDDTDLEMLRKYLLDLDKDSFPAEIADLNNDGNIDIADLVRLKEYTDSPDTVILGKNN